MMEEPSFTIRRPRHEVLAGSGCCISVEKASHPGRMAAQLNDISRQGLKVYLDHEIEVGLVLNIQLDQPRNNFHAVLPAIVRWSRLQDDGRWAAGCAFAYELTWELMGELFLHGILSVEELQTNELVSQSSGT